MTRAQRRKLEAWAPWIVTVLVLVVWQAVCTIFKVSDFIFPSPYTIAQALVEYARPIAQWRHAFCSGLS